MPRLARGRTLDDGLGDWANRVVELPDGSRATMAELNRLMWESGIGLVSMFSEVQAEFYQRYLELPPFTKLAIKCSRKIGKTFFTMLLANIVARGKKNAVIRYAFPTKEQGKTVIIPILEEVQRTCPPDLRWVNKEATEGCWYLPHTGARMYLAGSDTTDQIDRLRGPGSDLTVLDEVTFFHCNLRRLISGVLQPQLMRSKGKMILTGTPPESMDHPSIEYFDDALAKNRLIAKTIWDDHSKTRDDIRILCAESNLGATPVEIEQILLGLKTGSPEWEREYLCRDVSDKGRVVIPEFDPGRHVAETKGLLPFYADKFVFIDPGHVSDYFAAVFCILDYAGQKLLVVREYASRRQPTDKILADLRRIEQEAFGVTKPTEIVRRVMEPSNWQQITDFNSKGYSILTSEKPPGKHDLVLELENRLHANQIVIDPSCTNLIGQLKDGLWKDSTKADFQRSPKLGHLDHLDALATGLWSKAINWRRNPAPVGHYNDPNTIHIGPRPAGEGWKGTLGDIYGKQRVVSNVE